MFKVPVVPVRVPERLVRTIMPFAKRLIVKPLLDEDGVAVEAEQEGYEAHFDQPVPDLNPVVHAFQALTIRKWEEHLAGSSDGRPANEEARPSVAHARD